MGMRDRLRRAESRAEREALMIPQIDGPPVKLPKSAFADAFLHEMSRMCGEDLEPHPVHVAIANSPDPDQYAGTFLEGEMRIVDEHGEPLESGAGEDLSE
jgi:hypothetical protein